MFMSASEMSEISENARNKKILGEQEAERLFQVNLSQQTHLCLVLFFEGIRENAESGRNSYVGLIPYEYICGETPDDRDRFEEILASRIVERLLNLGYYAEIIREPCGEIDSIRINW